MSVGLVGTGTGTTSANLPAGWIPGDWAIVFAFRDGSATAPSLPGGWTQLGAAVAGSTCSERSGTRQLQAGDTTTGTWANATTVIVLVYRGASGIGATNTSNGTTNTVTYNSLTLTQNNGSSVVAGFAGHRSVDTTLESPPAGMFNKATVVDATDEAAAHDTHGGVTSWASTNVGITGTASGWVTRTVEILATAPVAGAGQFVTVSSQQSGLGGASSWVTSSVDPPPHRLLLLGVHWRRSSATTQSPTVSGLGLTWTFIRDQVLGSGQHRIALYRATGTPSSGAITFTFGEASIEQASMSLVYCNDLLRGTVVQSNSAPILANAPESVVILGAFSDPGNLPFGFFGAPFSTAADMAPATGWTQLLEHDAGEVDHQIVYAGSENLGVAARREVNPSGIGGIAIEVGLGRNTMPTGRSLTGAGV